MTGSTTGHLRDIRRPQRDGMLIETRSASDPEIAARGTAQQWELRGPTGE